MRNLLTLVSDLKEQADLANVDGKFCLRNLLDDAVLYLEDSGIVASEEDKGFFSQFEDYALCLKVRTLPSGNLARYLERVGIDLAVFNEGEDHWAPLAQSIVSNIEPLALDALKEEIDAAILKRNESTK